MKFGDTSRYYDIIEIKGFNPKRPRMERYKRAAQFAPFAALTGYDLSIKEASRLVEDKPELSDHMEAYIDLTLNNLINNINKIWEIKVTYFVKDELKKGGAIREKVGFLKEIKKEESCLIFQDSSRISLEDLLYVEILG